MNPRKGFEIVLPATSANLGPAFDAAALALDLDLNVRALPAPEFSIAGVGRDSEICASQEENLVLDTYRSVMEAEGRKANAFALEFVNQIPIGKGCGSSAAALLAGVSLAAHFGALGWPDDRILEEACRREGHADNVAACWLGGFAVAQSRDGSVRAVRVSSPARWPLLLAVSPEPLATEKARQALPDQYAKADAVGNLQNALLALAAYAEGRHDLLPCALYDRFHEPYREALCPLLPALRKLAERKEGILAAVLSGAGPSVLLFLDPKAKPEQVRSLVKDHLKKENLSAELLLTAIAERGASQRRKEI